MWVYEGCGGVEEALLPGEGCGGREFRDNASNAPNKSLPSDFHQSL